MAERDLNLLELLEYIPVADLSYQEWVNVGMALKHEGYTAADWEAWSRNDSRYHHGECFRKWDSFQGALTPVTGGTIVQMAKERGWLPRSMGGADDFELDWNSTIGAREGIVVPDTAWLEGREVKEPDTWNPVDHIIRYLETLFEAGENVGYVTQTWEKDGKFLPTKGNYDRTAGQLIEELSKCGGDVGAVLGDYNPAAGAWIRFNPLDGKGVKNENVTDFRYALVESDSMELEKQNAIIRELELPVACLVFSGGKSVHAIVKIEAATYEEYRRRVDYLYAVLKKNGFDCDTQNKNPSRLSRMPGVLRGEHKQFLMDTNIGKESFQEWRDWIESINDDLPDPDSLAAVWDDMPELSPPLIDGILRQGHKMLLVGPSKAGKSIALIELCCAIAEGREWLGWKCAQGRVLYVNLELDRASCLHRFRDIYTALGWHPEHLDSIDIWNLRGKSIPMDKLAPKLIRRASEKNYIAIIIDPIYKIITGDENSADQMAAFCNQFDRVATELDAAVIYCHHHSKGSQGGKRSMDRASGSGVFARDPDALIDMIELELTEAVEKQEKNKEVCAALTELLKNNVQGWQELVSQDDALSRSRMEDICSARIADSGLLERTIAAAERKAASRSAWRLEGTMREFPSFHPVNVWFDYPRHLPDETGILKDLTSDAGSTAKGSPYKRNFGNKKSKEELADDRKARFEFAFNACNTGGSVTVSDLAGYLGTADKTVRRRVGEHEDFYIKNGCVFRR